MSAIGYTGIVYFRIPVVDAVPPWDLIRPARHQRCAYGAVTDLRHSWSFGAIISSPKEVHRCARQQLIAPVMRPESNGISQTPPTGRTRRSLSPGVMTRNVNRILALIQWKRTGPRARSRQLQARELWLIITVLLPDPTF